MSRRELVLVGVILLLVGLLTGIIIGGGFGGDDAPDVVAQEAESSTTSSTTTSSTTTSSTTTSTTTSPTTSSTTTTSTTTTTTVAPFVQEVANLPERTVMGLPVGTHIDDVEFLMYEVFGEPTSDTGWSEGCPFDGEGDNERRISWDGLTLDFFLTDAGGVFGGWVWRPADPVPEGVLLTQQQQPDSWEIVLHDGVDPTMGLADIGATIGVAAMNSEWGFTVVTEDYTWLYLGLEPDSNEPPFEIMSTWSICD